MLLSLGGCLLCAGVGAQSAGACWHLSTRKRSWCKGKCTTAVHVWRPLTKKSKLMILPVDILLPISDFLLMVNSIHGCITYRLQDIFVYRGW